MRLGPDVLVIFVAGETNTYVNLNFQILLFLLVDGTSDILPYIQTIVLHLQLLKKEAKDFLKLIQINQISIFIFATFKSLLDLGKLIYLSVLLSLFPNDIPHHFM